MRAAFLFPGQGSYFPRAVEILWESVPETADIFATIDEVGSGLGEPPVRPVLFGTAELSLDAIVEQQPDALQLALYGLSLATYRGLCDRGVLPWALIGHSVGEIGALASAGVLTTDEGAYVFWRRIQAIRDYGRSGGMLALSTDADVAGALVRAVDDPLLALAVRNAPRQCVASGPAESLALLAGLAEQLGIANQPIRSSHPFHSPLLAAAVQPWREGIAHITPKPGTVPVYSSSLGRLFDEADRLDEVLTASLVRPCDFLTVVRQAHARGAELFLECGARDILTRLVRQTVPDVLTHAPLRRDQAAVDGLAQAAALARGEAPVASAAPAAPVLAAAPGAPAPGPSAAPAPGGTTRRPDVLARLRALYAAALEYPEEVLEEDADLDADLGVDSLRQTDLLAQVRQAFGLSEEAGQLRLADFPTLGHVADFVTNTATAPARAAPPR